MRNRKVFYISDLAVVTSVDIVCSNNSMSLSRDRNIWYIDDEFIATSEVSNYQLLINKQFLIPALDNEYLVSDNAIFSSPIKCLNNTAQILDFFACESIIHNKANDTYEPFKNSKTFYEHNEQVFFWARFFDVRTNFIIHLEIYSDNQLLNIIPFEITKSTKEQMYVSSYCCSFKGTYFSSSRKWQARIRISSEISQEITFNYISNQHNNYGASIRNRR